MDWDKVGSVLKKVLMIGGTAAVSVAKVYNPPMGLMLESILLAVTQAEAKLGDGKGDDKRELAAIAIQAALPGIIKSLADSGKPVRNFALFAEGLEDIQEGVVKVLNATGDRTKPE